MNFKNVYLFYKYLKDNGFEEVVVLYDVLVFLGKLKDKISWNFIKFLISKEGEILYCFLLKVIFEELLFYL